MAKIGWQKWFFALGLGAMRIKNFCVVLALALVTFSAAAYLIAPFSGWPKLAERSPDIVLVLAVRPTVYPPNVNFSGPRSDFQVEVTSVLKGTNYTASTDARLLTDHELRPYHLYLVFGQYTTNWIDAFEDYRAIQLDKKFQYSSIKDKTLDEQLQILFQSGVDAMNQQILDDEKERNHIKEALQK
jgi:hypothetical protein